MRFGRGYSQWLGGGPGGWGAGPGGPGGDGEGFGGGWGEKMRGRHGHHRGGPGGRRRMFDGDELRLILLALIAEGPRHGYDLIREIEERSGGAYAPSPGVVYPTLTMLDEMGLIDEVKEAGSRRSFAISGTGQAQVTEKQAEIEALMQRLAAIGEAQAKGDRAPIRRAMMNLGMALRETMSRDEDGAKAHKIAELLDETTRKIERL